MATDADFQLAMKAFELFTNGEQREALREFAGLRYSSLDDRFFEAVYRVIRRCADGEAVGTVDARPPR